MTGQQGIPSRLHVWGVIRDGDDGNLTVSPTGVTDDRGEALTHVEDELRALKPGAVGYVCVAPASGPVDTLEYPDSRLVAYAHLDEDTGTLVWRRGEAS